VLKALRGIAFTEEMLHSPRYFLILQIVLCAILFLDFDSLLC
jgi:hypothetical protein